MITKHGRLPSEIATQEPQQMALMLAAMELQLETLEEQNRR